MKACRLIGVDRPGMGLSDFNKHASISSWADDVANLVDILNIEQFSIIAHSGGAPFAAACAAKLGKRVASVALVSGMAPSDHPKFKIGMQTDQKIVATLIKYAPWLTTLMMKSTAMLLNNPDKLIKQVTRRLPEVDQQLFQNDEVRTSIINASKEAFKQGVKGAAYDMRLLFNPWDFTLDTIQSSVAIWQGTLDVQAPITQAEIYAELIPTATLNIIEGQGHHSLIRNYFNQIVESL